MVSSTAGSFRPGSERVSENRACQIARPRPISDRASSEAGGRDRSGTGRGRRAGAARRPAPSDGQGELLLEGVARAGRAREVSGQRQAVPQRADRRGGLAPFEGVPALRQRGRWPRGPAGNRRPRTSAAARNDDGDQDQQDQARGTGHQAGAVATSASARPSSGWGRRAAAGGQVPPQVARQGRRVGVAVARVAAQALVDDVRQADGDPRVAPMARAAECGSRSTPARARRVPRTAASPASRCRRGRRRRRGRPARRARPSSPVPARGT